MWQDNPSSSVEAPNSTTIAEAGCIRIKPGGSTTASLMYLRDNRNLSTDLTIGRKYRLF